MFKRTVNSGMNTFVNEFIAGSTIVSEKRVLCKIRISPLPPRLTAKSSLRAWLLTIRFANHRRSSLAKTNHHVNKYAPQGFLGLRGNHVYVNLSTSDLAIWSFDHELCTHNLPFSKVSSISIKTIIGKCFLLILSEYQTVWHWPCICQPQTW